MEALMKLGKGKPVVIIGKCNCGMTYAVQRLICGFGANPVVYKLDELQQGREIEIALLGLGCNPTVPAVFIGRLFVGGSDEVFSLSVKGKLKPLLLNSGAIWM